MGGKIHKAYAVSCAENNPLGSPTNNINRKTDCGMGANLVFFNSKKLVIHQTKNPCFFMDKEDWESLKGKKVNENTVEFPQLGTGKHKHITAILPYFYFGMRPDLGHAMVFHSNGKITSKIDMDEKFHNKLDGREVIQVLGTDRNCYLRPTVEEWLEYAYDRKNPTKTTFYLK